MTITRFNPGLNGPLHLGHVFTLLVNEYFAHNVGGKFNVRFDDTSFTSNKSGCRMNKVRYIQSETIKWLDVPVDEWSLQSSYFNEDILNALSTIIKIPDEDQTGYILPFSMGFGNEFVFYPYTPKQTAERVVMDNIDGITDVIRGEEFITEYSLYSYYCQLLKYPVPRFWYLPRLTENGKSISKTNGGNTIAEYKANGYSPQDIKDLLAVSCLIEPRNGWILQNIKKNPELIK